jgi:hypothetical protein
MKDSFRGFQQNEGLFHKVIHICGKRIVQNVCESELTSPEKRRVGFSLSEGNRAEMIAIIKKS